MDEGGSIEFDDDAESSPEIALGKIDRLVVGVKLSDGGREFWRELGRVAVALETNGFR